VRGQPQESPCARARGAVNIAPMQRVSKQPGWKDYPVPNQAFPQVVAGGTERLASASTVFLWCSWGIYTAGCIWTLIAYPVTGNAHRAINIGLWGVMLGWALLWFALPLYSRAQSRLMLARGEIIPALTGPNRRSVWFWILLWGPICIATMGTGLVGTIAVVIERANRVRLTVEYVGGGKLRRRGLWVRRHSNRQLWNEEVWVTRPRLFVPPRPVDRQVRLGELDNCTIDAKDWLHDAFYRSITRAESKRTVKRRARAIARIRHERGRSGRYK
jgi:hypothetical protein